MHVSGHAVMVVQLTLRLTSPAGTVNGNGVLQMEVNRTGQDTTLSASPRHIFTPTNLRRNSTTRVLCPSHALRGWLLAPWSHWHSERRHSRQSGPADADDTLAQPS